MESVLHRLNKYGMKWSEGRETNMWKISSAERMELVSIFPLCSSFLETTGNRECLMMLLQAPLILVDG